MLQSNISNFNELGPRVSIIRTNLVSQFYNGRGEPNMLGPSSNSLW